jgi:hypothetical protein
MKNKRGLASVAALLPLIALALAPAAAAAEEKAPGGIAELWVLWPKDGKTAEFEAAAKKFVAWRKQTGEPYSWTAFQPVVGDDLMHYVWRSGEHHWAELDANHEWAMKAKANEQYDKDMAPHVARIEHYLTEDDLAHSNWMEAEYRYFQVENFKIKPGGFGGMLEALDKIHKAAMAAKWPRSWAVSYTTGGDGGMTLVFPYKSYADMQEPDPPFMKVLAQQLGSEEAAKAAMQQLNASFEETRTTIYTVRPDLSTQP